MRRLFILILAGLVLAGCIRQRIEPAQQSAIRSVALVVLVQDKLHVLDQTGLFSHFDDYPDYDVSEWRVNERFRKAIAKELRSRGYAVTEVLPPYQEIWESEAYAESLRNHWQIFRGHAKDIGLLHASVYDTDAILVVYPGGLGWICRNEKQCIRYGYHGFGLLETDGDVKWDQPAVYASLDALLFDARTEENLAWDSHNVERKLTTVDFELEQDLLDYSLEERRAIRRELEIVQDQSARAVLDILGLCPGGTKPAKATPQSIRYSSTTATGEGIGTPIVYCEE